MKTFKQHINELDLSKEPLGDVVDLRNKKPAFKAGDKWSTADATGNTKYVSQKEADAINSGKAKGGSPFPDSWNKETRMADKDRDTTISKTPKGEVPDITIKKPETTTNTGFANPEWVKQHSWIKDAIKKR